MRYTYRVILIYYLNLRGGARWRSWLRLYATSPKVAVLLPLGRLSL
jgi:hypothetical protein